MQSVSDKDRLFASHALDLCRNKAKEGIKKGENPFGACVIYQNKIISCEHDHAMGEGRYTEHAEVVAIHSSLRKLRLQRFEEGAVLVTTCEPCPICVTTSQLAGISTIYFGMSVATGRRRGYLADSCSSVDCARMLGEKVTIESLEAINSTEDLIDFWEKRNFLLREKDKGSTPAP